MGVDHFDNLRAKVGKAKQFEKETFQGLPTYENFFYQHDGAYAVNQGNGVEMQLTVPGGHYEIEAIVRLYNNSDDRIVYSCGLKYYLDNALHELWEGGELGSTVDGKPYVLKFQTMSTFNEHKVIKFYFGTNAEFGGMAGYPMIMARRVGAIKFTSG